MKRNYGVAFRGWGPGPIDRVVKPLVRGVIDETNEGAAGELSPGTKYGPKRRSMVVAWGRGASTPVSSSVLR